MKKILFLFFVLLFSSCGNSSQIEQAKQEILSSDMELTTFSGELVETASGTQSPIKSTKNTLTLRSLSLENYLIFNDMSSVPLNSGEISFRGKAEKGVERIVVTFENKDSKFPKDEYILQTFQAGDTEFSYLASSRFQVLDYGTNTYTFTAYKGQESTQTQIEIFIVPEISSEKGDISSDVRYDQKILGAEGNSIDLELPSSPTYGNPISMGETSMTYTNIDGFEIQKQSIASFSCENISEALAGIINTWFYWNSCRDLISGAEESDKKLVSFYVVRLDGDKYIYEKQYVDFVHGLRATLALETGIGVTKESIAAKNSELKLKNQGFSQTQITDNLMLKIVNTK